MASHAAISAICCLNWNHKWAIYVMFAGQMFMWGLPQMIPRQAIQWSCTSKKEGTHALVSSTCNMFMSTWSTHSVESQLRQHMEQLSKPQLTYTSSGVALNRDSTRLRSVIKNWKFGDHTCNVLLHKTACARIFFKREPGLIALDFWVPMTKVWVPIFFFI